MLDLYKLREFVPNDIEIIRDNREFFCSVTIDKLDASLNGILDNTDKAVYKNNRYFTDRFGITVPWYCLSTGGMTVLNIMYNTDKCFDLLECGINAIYDLLKLKDGKAVGFYAPSLKENGDCYIRYNGRDDCIYYRLEDFL